VELLAVRREARLTYDTALTRNVNRDVNLLCNTAGAMIGPMLPPRALDAAE
jgi:hypothetical protein